MRILDNLTLGFSDIGRALASKDLEEPANIEALVDVIVWMAVIVLAIILAFRGEAGYFNLFCMAFGFTVFSIIWCIFHYTVLRIFRNR